MTSWTCTRCGRTEDALPVGRTLLDTRYREAYCVTCKRRTTFHAGEPRAVARATDPDTSWSAAQSIRAERIRASQAAILAILRTHGPLTDEGIWPHVDGQSLSGARTRRSELVAQGLVEDSGRRALTAAGRRSIVWRAVNGTAAGQVNSGDPVARPMATVDLEHTRPEQTKDRVVSDPA